MLYNKKIYRGISSKYKNYPFNASAMREKDLAFLENLYIQVYGNKSFEKYKHLISNLKKSEIELFMNVDSSCPWAWFLSIINILIAIKNDVSLLENIHYNTRTSAFENLAKISLDSYPQAVFNITCDVFSQNRSDLFSSQSLSYSIASYTVYGLEYFQHLNYDLRGNLDYNPFPTLVMDWTDDIQIANSFASGNNNLEKIIVAIDYDKYKKLLFDEWYSFGVDEFIAATIPGVTPYFDYHFIYSKKNINMQNQKGIILFWPWNYTITDLQHNSLGKSLGFEIINI